MNRTGHNYGPTSDRRGETSGRPACFGKDPEIFFPVGDTYRMDREKVEQAKAICKRCEVVDQCLEGAMERGEHYGVWGGLSERERAAIKRRKDRQVVVGGAATRLSS